MQVCSIDHCGRRVDRRGYCYTHYKRFRKGEDLTAPIAARARSADESFKLNTERRGDCLIWTSHRQSKGYGVITSNGRQVLAHRWSFEKHNGPIPEGMLVDHVCHDRLCVEPLHLRIATPAENEWNRSGPNAGSRSGVRNVYPHGPGYRVQIRCGNEHLRFGTYPTLERAAEVAEEKRRELFGEYAGRG